MKRVFRCSTYLLLALISFSLFTCGQSQFTGTTIKPDIADVFVKFNGREFESVYSPGSPNFTMAPVSSKQTTAIVKVVTGEKGLNVKIRGVKATPSKNNALEFQHKLNLKTGTNKIPVLVYREDEKIGQTFEIQVTRQVSEGALRLIHLKCKYKNYRGDDIETDDLIDELPYNGIYERRFANDSEVTLEAGSPELDKQRVEINGAVVKEVSTASEFYTYKIPLKTTDPTSVDITVYDSNKELEQTFHLSFMPLSKEQKESTDIEVVKLTTEDGDVFEFDKLDMLPLDPYKKGMSSSGKESVEIENIYKLKTTLLAPINGIKPVISIKMKEPGAKVELVARWDEADHDQTSRQGLKGEGLPSKAGWNYGIETNSSNFARADHDKKTPVLLGHDTDTEFRFCPYNQGKFDFLFKITSSDKSKVRYYEVKYGFIFLYAYFFDMEPFQAVVERSSGIETKPAVVKASDEEGLYNVYLPHDTKSVRFIADDKINVNLATGYRKSYYGIWDYRFYLRVDDGDFSRTHPSVGEENYKEFQLTSFMSQEEHKLSVVTYQDGKLEKGVFVDEYGNEEGVQKIQKDFKFKFIKEDRRVAPSLSVLKVEGTPTTAFDSAINGKVWPTLSFRPAISENKVALVQKDVKYKLKMLKTDSSSKIYIDGQEVSTTEPFTQHLQSVSEKFPALIPQSTPDTVNFYTYELTDAKYYQGGILQPTTILIDVVSEKDGTHREYQLKIEPVNPDENDTLVTVIDSNGGSSRNGTRVLYKEHKAKEELKVNTDGKLYEGDFQVLGTTGVDGVLSGKGKLKAGRYYDIYALGNDKETADSMIEHYYVTGEKGEVIDLIQMSLVQNGGSDYKEGNVKPIRGNCPVRLKKQKKTATENNDGAYFFFRQATVGGGGLGGLGGGSKSFQLKPCNLTCGDAHIKMADSDAGALTDMVLWFDVSSGNTVEPVAWGPTGVKVAFDNTPFSYTLSIDFTEYKPNGQVSILDSAVEQQTRYRWKFPSGVYDLVLVAYDVAGNRLERHQLVSIEAANMMKGQNPGFDNDKDERKVKFENFRVLLFRWPIKMNLFENKQYFENLFGMPWTEYTPPEGQGDAIKTPSSYIAIGRGYIGDDSGPTNVSGVDLYRRCVDDGTPFKKVGSTIPPFMATAFGSMDTDFTLEEGKTYQYKMVAFIDEGNSLETEYLAEIKVPPATMYFLDNIKVEGQGGKVPDGTIYKYNANKKDKEIPLLKTVKYPSGTPNKDKTKLKIDYSARVSNPKLWNKDYAEEIEFGITVHTRDNEVVFGSKCAISIDDDGNEELFVYLPTQGKYVSLYDLIKMKILPTSYSMEDLVTFDKEKGLLTIKDAYLKVGAFNWNAVYGGDGTFDYEAGNTYYWDIVSWGRYPIGGNTSPLTITKTFDAKKKNAPHEKYRDDEGNTKTSGIYMIFGNGDYDGSNSINGRCRFTVTEED